MTDVPRANADGGGTGSVVPMPLDWPESGQPNGFAVGPRVLREVAKHLRNSAEENQPPATPTWQNRGSIGAVRALNAEPGVWASARTFQHVHAQLQEGLAAFYGALLAGLPAVAAKLEQTATNYEQAEQESTASVTQASAAAHPPTAPNVVGPDGRF